MSARHEHQLDRDGSVSWSRATADDATEPPRWTTWVASRSNATWVRLALMLPVLVAFGQYILTAARQDEVDFGVYRAGGHAFLAGHDLYLLRVPPVGLPFTYPPASAVFFSPLSWMPVRPGQVVWMAASLVGLCLFVRLTMLRYAAGDAAKSIPLLLVVLALVAWSNPLSVGLNLGQINVLIAVLVVADLSGVLPRLPRGVMIGVAAALKLTPLFLVGYFIAVRRYRAAAVATCTFVAVTAAGFLLAPHASHQYWLQGYFADPRRTGGISYISNQSLYGVIVRLAAGPSHVRVFWLPAVILTGGVVLWAARQLEPRLPWLAEGMALAAMLLISPVSWVHHWILVLPFVVACCRLGTEATRRPLLLWLALTLCAVLLLGAVWWVPNNNHLEYKHNAWQFLLGNSAVLLLLASIAAVIAATLRVSAARPVLAPARTSSQRIE